MNERGITLQTTIVTAVLALAAAAAGIVIYNVVSDESEEISENAVAADGVDRFWEADDDSGNPPPDDNGDDPLPTEQEDCVTAGGTWESSACTCPSARTWTVAKTCVPSAAETGCTEDGGTWTGSTCDCPASHTWNGVDNCDEDTPASSPEQDACVAIYGAAAWTGSTCTCPATLMGAEWIYDSGSDSGTCECPTGEIEKDGICIEAETTNTYSTRHVYVSTQYSCGVVGDIGMDGVFVTSETIDNSDDSVTSTPSGFQCWGRDIVASQLINTAGGHSATPVENPTTDSFKVLDTGPYNMCYATSSGTLKCLGHGNSGRLGRLTPTDNSNIPQPIPSLVGVESVSVGWQAICTIAFNGETAKNVWCYGSNSSGSFGAGHAKTVFSTPVKVAGLTGATQVAVSISTLCAIIGTGSTSEVKCQGGNGDKELGQGDTTARSGLQTVSDAEGAKAISAGKRHFCIITSDDKVACWGKNDTSYNLGVGATGTVGTPTEISGVTGVTHLDVNGESGGGSCFLYGSGSTLKCVGSNLDVTKTMAPSSTPSISATFTSVQTGGKHVCVTTSENKIWCLANGATADDKIRIGQLSTETIVAYKFYEVDIS